jgi:CheY-like chemotaxis protein
LTDPLRLRQILMNLLSNAIKFTERGEVLLRVRCETDAKKAGIGELIFEVVDTGIGMSADEIPRLFRPFTQADSSTTRRFGGTGLGLTISRRLALLLGGDMGVQSIPGAGSTFTLWVPVGIPAAGAWIDDLAGAAALALADVGDAGPVALRGRILLAEDGEDNQRLLAAILRKAGADVEVVADGGAAVRAALAREFDVILMDMQMPVKDGYMATRELRAAGCATPILALTAHAMAEDRERCLAVGCTDYLTKPIEEGRFLSTVARQMQHAGSVTETPTPVEMAAPVSAARSRYADHPVIGGLLPQFIRDLQRQMADGRNALQAGDRTALAELMHRIKGAGGAYGYDGLTRMAAAIEQQIRAGGAMETMEHAFAELAAYAEEIATGVESVAGV